MKVEMDFLPLNYHNNKSSSISKHLGSKAHIWSWLFFSPGCTLDLKGSQHILPDGDELRLNQLLLGTNHERVKRKVSSFWITRPPQKIPPHQEQSKIYFRAQAGSRTRKTSKCQEQKGACLSTEEQWLSTSMAMSEMPSSDGCSFWGGCREVFFTRTSFPFLVSPFHWLCLWACKSVLPCNGELAYLCVGVRQPLII